MAVVIPLPEDKRFALQANVQAQREIVQELETAVKEGATIVTRVKLVLARAHLADALCDLAEDEMDELSVA